MRSVIDPVTRIEGHLKVEMEVSQGTVTEAWASGGLFRGMELVLEGKAPEDAAYISQRICGVCPVSHANASSFAGEAALGITELADGARLVRNIVECSQFLHSNILWFYNLAGLDYVDPTHALEADVASAYDLAQEAGTGVCDFGAVQSHLQTFVENGQLSIFSGNWFDRDSYSLPAELDLIATAHYLEALEYQAISSEISALLGGKMPHVMSQIPGGTTTVPTISTLDDALAKAKKINTWVTGTLLPDAVAIAGYYDRAFYYGQGCGRYIAWGVFNDPTQLASQRYLPSGVIGDEGTVSEPDETLITEYTGSSYYATSTNLNPREGVTDPEYPAEGYNVYGKYTWSKSPHYNGDMYEAGPLSRMLVAYKKEVSRVVELVDYALEAVGHAGDLSVLQSTLGRVVCRACETVYISELIISEIEELMAAVSEGSAKFFTKPHAKEGEGAGMWEAPRGALYHYMKVSGGKIEKYQIIIPTTWNIAPRDADGVHGPMEQALIGVPIDDPEKPIDALRTVHSFDPCVACAVHVAEPATGKHFETVTNPWGVK